MKSYWALEEALISSAYELLLITKERSTELYLEDRSAKLRLSIG